MGCGPSNDNADPEQKNQPEIKRKKTSENVSQPKNSEPKINVNHNNDEPPEIINNVEPSDSDFDSERDNIKRAKTMDHRSKNNNDSSDESKEIKRGDIQFISDKLIPERGAKLVKEQGEKTASMEFKGNLIPPNLSKNIKPDLNKKESLDSMDHPKIIENDDTPIHNAPDTVNADPVQIYNEKVKRESTIRDTCTTVDPKQALMAMGYNPDNFYEDSDNSECQENYNGRLVGHLCIPENEEKLHERITKQATSDADSNLRKQQTPTEDHFVFEVRESSSGIFLIYDLNKVTNNEKKNIEGKNTKKPLDNKQKQICSEI